MVQSPIQQRFVDKQVAEALIRAGLPYDSPLRQKLNSEAEIIGPAGEGYVRMRDDHGELVSIPERSGKPIRGYRAEIGAHRGQVFYPRRVA